MKSGTIAAALLLLATMGRAGNREISPLELHWPREAALLTLGIGGQILGQERLSNMEPPGPADLKTGDLPPWDRFTAGRYSPAADAASEALTYAVGGSILLAEGWRASLYGSGWRSFLEDALILGEALTWSSALNTNVRALRVHPRPFVYDSSNGSSAAMRAAPEAAGSFYSGHASGAFLGAAYLATVYPLRHPEFRHAGWLWAGSLAAASAAATARVAAGKHFPSDVAAGAAAGTLLGWGFARMHRARETGTGTSWRFDAWPLAGDGLAVQASRSLAAW